MEGNFNLTGEELILRIQKGGMAAFEALYNRHHMRLFHFILSFVWERTLAEDILQETFLRVLRERKTYGKCSHFSTYLFTIG